eukprot:scaffold242212_cov22-Tisochrysis_lutea.AAC.1
MDAPKLHGHPNSVHAGDVGSAPALIHMHSLTRAHFHKLLTGSAGECHSRLLFTANPTFYVPARSHNLSYLQAVLGVPLQRLLVVLGSHPQLILGPTRRVVDQLQFSCTAASGHSSAMHAHTNTRTPEIFSSIIWGFRCDKMRANSKVCRFV